MNDVCRLQSVGAFCRNSRSFCRCDHLCLWLSDDVAALSAYHLYLCGGVHHRWNSRRLNRNNRRSGDFFVVFLNQALLCVCVARKRIVDLLRFGVEVERIDDGELPVFQGTR